MKKYTAIRPSIGMMFVSLADVPVNAQLLRQPEEVFEKDVLLDEEVPEGGLAESEPQDKRIRYDQNVEREVLSDANDSCVSYKQLTFRESEHIAVGSRSSAAWAATPPCSVPSP